MVAETNREIITPYGSFIPSDSEISDEEVQLPPNEWEAAEFDKEVRERMLENTGGEFPLDPWAVQRERARAITEIGVASVATSHTTK